MICKNCSTEFEGKFCPECGAPAEEIEQTAEQVAEQENVAEPVAETAEPVADEPATEEIADGVVEESVTPPATADEGIPTSEPEGYYYEPARGDGEIVDAPPKKKKKGLIIAIVIIVVLAAAFCVTAFTDLIFPKQAQFISILNNMGSDVEADFDSIAADSIEARYSVKLNGDNDTIAEAIPEEAIDLINSLGFSAKVTSKGENGADAICSLFEGDNKLADILLSITPDAYYGKFDFSDFVFKMPFEEFETDYDVEGYTEFVEEELRALLEKNEPVKGEYDGEFTLGMDVKTLTVTLGEDEINETLDKLIEEAVKTFGITEPYTKPSEGFGIKEVTVSSLYTGAFSFARKSLGVYVTLKTEDGEEIEVIFFSNKENKAIYGVSAEVGGQTGSIVFTDNFEIKNGEQTGVISMTTTGVASASANIFGINSIPSITYSIKKNNFNCNLRIVDDGDIAEIKFSAVRDDNGIGASVVLDINTEEFGGIYLDIAECDPVTVDIDTSKAIDVTKNFTDDEEEALANLVTDLQTLMEGNEDSMLFAFLGEALSVQGDAEYPIEQYMWDEYDIEHYATEFDTSERASYVWSTDGMIDVQEFGYENDIIKEMTETVYLDVYGYTEAQQQMVLQSMQNSFAHAEDMEDVFIYHELYDDYVITTVTMYNLDNSQNLKAFIDAGLIVSDNTNVAQLSFSQSASILDSTGYERVE